MKRFLWWIFILTSGVWALTPFKQGVNLTNWFQASSAHRIPFNAFDEHDLQNIQTLGCDVIRLPLNLQAMIGKAPDYPVDPLLFELLDRVVSWAEDLNLYLILDNHSFDPNVNTDTSIVRELIPLWKQIAAHYKNRSKYVLYEILNEPHGISDEAWNAIQQEVVQAIRSIDTVHTIVVGPAGWNSYTNLQYMPQYADSNLLYTFHFYEPFVFTHQGASWTSPSMITLSGVPFPYSASRMPACPADLKGTWIENALNDYPNHGTVGYVRQQLDMAFRFAQTRNLPIFCGELGVYMPNSPPSDRVIWYQIVREYLAQHQTPFTTWDYKGGFGLFEKGSNEQFDYDLNIPLLKALGLHTPPQKIFVPLPDSVGFALYDDFFGRHISATEYLSGGQLDFYNRQNPHRGSYNLYWSNAGQYNYIGFDFQPNKDLSVLKDRNFAVDFWVRASGQAANFVLRFIDTKTDDAQDHPWRMDYTVRASDIDWDGTWQHLQIKLKDFKEGGSWDNGWFNPQGKFDWSAVDLFEIVAGQNSLQGSELWFDDVYIANPQAVGLAQQELKSPASYRLEKAYPNPFNGNVRIEFSLSSQQHLRLEVFDIRGQKIRTLTQGLLTAGHHYVIWDGKDNRARSVSSGIYFLRLLASGNHSEQKIILMR